MNFAIFSSNEKVVDANYVTETNKAKPLFENKGKNRVLRKPKCYICKNVVINRWFVPPYENIIKIKSLICV